LGRGRWYELGGRVFTVGRPLDLLTEIVGVLIFFTLPDRLAESVLLEFGASHFFWTNDR